MVVKQIKQRELGAWHPGGVERVIGRGGMLVVGAFFWVAKEEMGA
jgi:hypothetical protein